MTSNEIYPAVAFGIDGVEHLGGITRPASSPKRSTRNRTYRDVTDLVARSGVALTPTLGIEGGFEARETADRSLLVDPRLSLFPPPVLVRLTDLATARAEPAPDAALRACETTLKTIVKAGGTIVAGTDSPNVPYGLGLHVELEEYVHAGLTPVRGAANGHDQRGSSVGPRRPARHDRTGQTGRSHVPRQRSARGHQGDEGRAQGDAGRAHLYRERPRAAITPRGNPGSPVRCRYTADSERRDGRQFEAVPEGAPISSATSVGAAKPGRVGLARWASV